MGYIEFNLSLNFSPFLMPMSLYFSFSGKGVNRLS
uniref:Uncharacterized protein n=1 Tax=Rhizophora mucronata TaxID=61149 RepID=A0A2P2PFS7_RHIMU